MNHPLPEELFDAARAGDPGVHSAHLAACAECRSAYDRLRAGAAMLDEASETPPFDDFDWSRIDAAVSAEAERVASDIRAGRLRAPRPWRTYAAMGGLTLAAAAAAVAYVRTNHSVEVEAVAHREATPQQAPAVAASERFEGAVLLAAGGATQTPSGESAAVRVSAGAAMREGARVATTTVGRAVFAVQPAVTLDVRPGTDVTLTTLRQGSAVVTLAQGEVALDREGIEGAVALRAGRWTVGVEGDAVARVESHTLRVVVLSGRATVEADGVSRMQYTGPIVIELPDEGASRTATGDAVDASHIDLSALRAGGTMWALPAINPAATLSVRGRGPLPSSLEAIRVAEPVTIQARFGHTLMTLEVGTGRVLQWHTVNAVASAQPPVRQSPAVAPSVIQSPVAEGRVLTGVQIRAMSGRVAPRLQHCVSTCQEQNRCQRGTPGFVEFEIAPDGRVTFSSAAPSIMGAQRCFTTEARFIRFPETDRASTFRVNTR